LVFVEAVPVEEELAGGVGDPGPAPAAQTGCHTISAEIKKARKRPDSLGLNIFN
jgi:hypothetical protein